MKRVRYERVKLEAIAGGGQAIGTLDDGRKLFVWGGLPDEAVTVCITKKKSKMLEGIVTEVHTASPERVEPNDPESYLSTSPWQIMSFAAEQRYKAQLIDDAFSMHHVTLPVSSDMYSNGVTERYRNKVEFSWYGQTDATEEESLHLAFFRRGGKGKIIVDDSSLLPEPMVALARRIRDDLQSASVIARQLKTLLIRIDQSGNCVWQIYAKDEELSLPTDVIEAWPAIGGELIYSDPRSPASRITRRLQQVGQTRLTDHVLGVPFHYATESFFQVNLPVYEQALQDMKQWVIPNKPTVDMYAGVGSIGLTIGGDGCTLVEINQAAVEEMKRNIATLDKNAQAILAPSEQALKHITTDQVVIVDPPRAGLHTDLINRLLEVKPPRIIYLSCNPVTQARDVAQLLDQYQIIAQRGYNFFPRTPHIEHLIVLDAL